MTSSHAVLLLYIHRGKASHTTVLGIKTPASVCLTLTAVDPPPTVTY